MPFKSQLADVRPAAHYNDLVSEFFWRQLDQFAGRTLLVDYETGRQWTGAQIKRTATRLAQNLVQVAGMRPNDDTVFLVRNNDRLLVASLAVLFAGGSVCAGAPEDPEQEHSYMISCMEAKFVLATRTLLAELVRIRAATGLAFKIIIMDDDDDHHHHEGPEQQQQQQQQQQHIIGDEEAEKFTFKFSAHLMAEPPLKSTSTSTSSGGATEVQLPVQVHPDRPAFVLLTSGSTGRPKPVGRSQRNSLYVCHSLQGAEHLWRLDETSVLAGHLPLDHGTGTFCLKMTLAKGLRLVVMAGYDYHQMLAAIERHHITDLILGSAYVHNFITAPAHELRAHNLSSLRNLLAVGSRLASREAANLFEAAHPNCSVRQAFGSTECGFMAIQERATAAQDHLTVGPLLPNLTIKIVARPDDGGGQPQVSGVGGVEITKPDERGELYASGPTVAPGYVGVSEFRGQAAACFLPDGYYRTNDICSLTHDHRLVIHGRFSEILCLLDGWKVLPAEIEQVLLQHPRVKEAAVVGIPHPDLPTCHAARAYVVLRQPGEEAEEVEEAEKPVGTQAQNGHQVNSSENKLDERRRPAAAAAAAAASEAELFEFSARLLAEPKHLTGGIKIMKELPRISVGKVDKKLLKQMDGY